MTKSEGAELVQELADKQALLELVTRYCRAVDRHDEDLLLSCYHPDAFDDHGAQKGTPQEMIAYMRRGPMDPSGPRRQLALTNCLFDVQGDVAWGECYLETRVIVGEQVERGLARYADRYERRDGEWRIARRTVILEHARPGLRIDDFEQGARDKTDPTYRRD